MKNAYRLLLVALVVAWIPAAAMAAIGDGGTIIVERTFWLGYWDSSVDGSPDLAAEYRVVGDGPDLGVKLNTIHEWGAIDFYARYRDSADQDYKLDFDVNRVFRSQNLLSTLIHRLGHQPIEHFQAVTNHGRVVWESDLNPDSEYDFKYQVFETKNEVQLPSLDGLTVGFGFRSQQRKGTRQHTTISHCDACHVNSQDRPTDETTDDAYIDLKYAWASNFVRGSYTGRSFSESPQNITLLFDDALHPELRVPVFDNRLQFDSAEGPQPVDLVPDISKDIFKLDTLINTSGWAIVGEGVWSSTENDFTRNKADFSGFMASVAKRFGESRRWNFRWRGRTYKTETTTELLVPIQRPGIAGPQSPGTYSFYYPDWPQTFDRLPSLNRDVVESKADITYRLANRNMGSLRAFWNYDSLDREYQEVAPGTTSTSKNVLGATWSARPGKGWKTYAGIKFADISNPFQIVDGKYSTLISEASGGSAFDPRAAQYWLMHSERIAEGTASPSSYFQGDLRGTYLRDGNMLTASFRYWKGDNNDGDLNDWARDSQTFNITYWATPSPDWQWYVGYNYNDTSMDSVATIPIFDG